MNILETLNKQYNTEHKDIYTLLKEYDIGYEAEETGVRYSHRWWDEVERIIPIENTENCIRFLWAEANRDESVEDLGWQFSDDSVYWVKPEKVTRIKWVKI